MRNSREISVELEARMAELQSAAEEERSSKAAEVEALTRELQDAQIDEAAKRALANQRVFSKDEKKDLQRFSISKLIREAAAGKVTGFEAEMSQEAEKEMSECGRALAGVGIPSFINSEVRYDNNNSQTATEGVEFVDTKTLSYVDSLKGQLLASRLGVTYLNNLRGNVKFVVGRGATANWEAEEAADSVAKQLFDAVTLTPHRLSITNGFTYDLLHQSSLDVDRMIMREMTREHAAALDAAIFAGSGSSGAPTGIIYNSGVNVVALDTAGAAIDYSDIIDLEKEVAIDNALAGRLAYVSNAKVMASLKKTAQIAGYPLYLMNDGKVNGYDFFMTNGIPSNLTKSTGSNLSAMIFGDFTQVVTGAWGGLDIIVDTISGKKKGVVELTAIAYHDVAVKQPKAFAVCKDIITA